MPILESFVRRPVGQNVHIIAGIRVPSCAKVPNHKEASFLNEALGRHIHRQDWQILPWRRLTPERQLAVDRRGYERHGLATSTLIAWRTLSKASQIVDAQLRLNLGTAQCLTHDDCQSTSLLLVSNDLHNQEERQLSSMRGGESRRILS